MSEHSTKFTVGEKVFTLSNDKSDVVCGRIHSRVIKTHVNGEIIEYAIIGINSSTIQWTRVECDVMNKADAMKLYWQRASDDFMKLFGGTS